MRGQSQGKKFIVVVCIAAVIVFAVYEAVSYFSWKKSGESNSGSSISNAATSSSSGSSSTNPGNGEERDCQAMLAAQAASNSIATGTILVSFTASTSLTQAAAILSTVGASSTAAASDSASVQAFAANHIIQASVIPGTEITTACTLRENPAVHYAGLDTLFFLHD